MSADQVFYIHRIHLPAASASSFSSLVSLDEEAHANGAILTTRMTEHAEGVLNIYSPQDLRHFRCLIRAFFETDVAGLDPLGKYGVGSRQYARFPSLLCPPKLSFRARTYRWNRMHRQLRMHGRCSGVLLGTPLVVHALDAGR